MPSRPQLYHQRIEKPEVSRKITIAAIRGAEDRLFNLAKIDDALSKILKREDCQIVIETIRKTRSERYTSAELYTLAVRLRQLLSSSADVDTKISVLFRFAKILTEFEDSAKIDVAIISAGLNIDVSEKSLFCAVASSLRTRNDFSNFFYALALMEETAGRNERATDLYLKSICASDHYCDINFVDFAREGSPIMSKILSNVIEEDVLSLYRPFGHDVDILRSDRADTFIRLALKEGEFDYARIIATAATDPANFIEAN